MRQTTTVTRDVRKPLRADKGTACSAEDEVVTHSFALEELSGSRPSRPAGLGSEEDAVTDAEDRHDRERDGSGDRRTDEAEIELFGTPDEQDLEADVERGAECEGNRGNEKDALALQPPSRDLQ